DRLAERLVEIGQVVVAGFFELLDPRELGRPDLQHEIDEVRQRNSLHEAPPLRARTPGATNDHDAAPAGAPVPTAAWSQTQKNLHGLEKRPRAALSSELPRFFLRSPTTPPVVRIGPSGPAMTAT